MQTETTKPQTTAAAPVAQTTATDLEQFLQELNAGRLHAQMSHAISICAAAAFDNAGTSKVTLELSIKRNEAGSQMIVASMMKYAHPTSLSAKGKTEVVEGKTLMHISKGGRLTFAPENQGKLFESAAPRA